MSEPRGLLDLGRSVIGALPPAFIVLCAFNLIFLWLAVRFIEHQADQRMVLITKVLDACLGKP